MLILRTRMDGGLAAHGITAGQVSGAVLGRGVCEQEAWRVWSLERYDCDAPPATPAQEALTVGELAVIEDVAERPSSCARCACGASGWPGNWQLESCCWRTCAAGDRIRALSTVRQRGAVAVVLPTANDGAALLADPARAALARGSVLVWPIGGWLQTSMASTARRGECTVFICIECRGVLDTG